MRLRRGRSSQNHAAVVTRRWKRRAETHAKRDARMGKPYRANPFDARITAPYDAQYRDYQRSLWQIIYEATYRTEQFWMDMEHENELATT